MSRETAPGFRKFAEEAYVLLNTNAIKMCFIICRLKYVDTLLNQEHRLICEFFDRYTDQFYFRPRGERNVWIYVAR